MAQGARAIHDQVCTQGYNPELRSFTQAYGSKELDASLLLVPAVGFLPVDDERVVGTIEAVKRDLMVNGFVARYNNSSGVDGLPGGEATFLPCSPVARLVLGAPRPCRRSTRDIRASGRRGQ